MEYELLSEYLRQNPLIGYTDSDFWLINSPYDMEACCDAVFDFRSQIPPRTRNRHYVNTIFYNHITSFDDIITNLKDTYSSATNAYKLNFCLGAVT